MAEDGFFGFVLIVGIIIGGIVVGIFADMTPDGGTKKLGGAVCDKEFNMSFSYYDDENNELNCKLKTDNIETVNYDGIKINLKK